MAVFSSPLLPPLGPWSLASVALLVWAFIKLKNFGKREAYLPPGPPTLPILGNLHNFPKTHAHKKFTEWSKEFGEIFSLKLGNSNVIVLNKPETINQVLEKGSATTSDRPPNHFFRVIEGGEVLNLVMMPHNSRWKSTRRAAHEVLSPQACRSHLEVQQAEGIQLAFNFLTDPARFYDHTRRYAHSVIMSVMFGMRVPRTESQFLVDFWDLTDDMIDITSPTNHPPVDLLPIFKLVPERFARWKGLCRKLREKQLKTFVPLIKEVENRLARGENTGCFMEEVVSHAKEWGLDEGDVLYLGFMIVQAGSDTTAVFIQNFILFMMAFPHVLKKAQREMDAVIGTDRMPRVDDIANLPYLRAMMNETHRFRPAAPLGVPHVATADVQYGEHVIPKGSMIFQNTYGVFHDPEIFENPEEFNPDRFIKNPELNKLPDLVFGSGRRFCVGVHLARNSLTINILNIVWGFNIEKPHEDFEPPIHNYEDGLVNYPLHFEAVLKPRSQQREAVLRQEYKNTEYTFKKYESHFSEEDKSHVLYRQRLFVAPHQQRARLLWQRQEHEQRLELQRSVSRATLISRASKHGSTLSRNQSLIKRAIQPQHLRPSDVLIERFVAWKAIVNQLIAYFEGIADIENNLAKELTRFGAVIQVPFRSGNQFLGEGGIQDVYYSICDKTRVIADQHANLGRTIDNSIVQHLERLRTEIKAHIKNIQNDTGKLATNVAEERELSARYITELSTNISLFKNSPMNLTSKSDPFIANQSVLNQLQKQIHEENLLQKSIIIMQQNSAHFEAGIVQALQSAWQTFDERQTRSSQSIASTYEGLTSHFASLQADAEWISFAARSDHLLDPETPLRNPTRIGYPSKEDPAVIPVHSGWLERMKRYKRRNQESYFVLTPAGFLHELRTQIHDTMMG